MVWDGMENNCSAVARGGQLMVAARAVIFRKKSRFAIREPQWKSCTFVTLKWGRLEGDINPRISWTSQASEARAAKINSNNCYL